MKKVIVVIVVAVLLASGLVVGCQPSVVKGSGNLSTMTKAKGYVIIPESREGLESGEGVTVHLFDDYRR